MQKFASTSIEPMGPKHRSSSVCPTVAVTDDMSASVVIYEPNSSMAEICAKKPSPSASGSVSATPNH